MSIKQTLRQPSGSIEMTLTIEDIMHGVHNALSAYIYELSIEWLKPRAYTININNYKECMKPLRLH